MGKARDHKIRILAEKEASDPQATDDSGNQAALMSAQLRAHKVELKKVKSIQMKIAKKRTFIGDYWPYVDGVLAAENGKQDDILMTVFSWALDVGAFERAIDIATYALAYDLQMPSHFKRNVQEILVEQTADYILSNLKDLTGQKQILSHMEDIIDLTAELDMVDEVKAKGFKAIGSLLEETDPKRTIEYFDAALSFDEKCGVKTALNKLRKKVEDQT